MIFLLSEYDVAIHDLLCELRMSQIEPKNLCKM